MEKYSFVPCFDLKRRKQKKERTPKRSGEPLKRREIWQPWKSSEQPVIQYDSYRYAPAKWAISVGKGLSVCALFAYTFYRSSLIFFLLAPLAFGTPILERKKKIKERKNQLASQFKEGMVVLASALSAGYSVENAIATSREELVLLFGESSLVVGEFSYLMQQVRMNRPVELVLKELAERSGIEEISNFSEVFGVAKRSGGDLSQIMRHTAEVIREKMQVKEEIATLTASKQFEQKIMNLIPFFLVFYIDSSSPGFFSQMYETGLGRIIMTVCMVIYLAAYFLAKKILEIEV